MEGEQHHRQRWEEHDQDHLSEEDEVPGLEGEQHRQRHRQEVHDEGQYAGSNANQQNGQPQRQKVKNKSRKVKLYTVKRSKEGNNAKKHLRAKK